MSIFTPMVAAVAGASKKASKPGFYDEVTTGIRRYDPLQSKRMFDQLRLGIREAGQGYFNRGRLALRNAGLGRSALMANLAGASAGMQARAGSRAMLDWGQREQDFTEQARQFDTQTALALKELFTRKKMQEDASKMNFGQFMGGLVGAGGQAASGYFGRG